MKNLIFFVVFLITSLTGFSDSDYFRGFEAGYQAGYCQSKGIGCIPPISPTPTMPKNADFTYQSGYNNGFEIGLNDSKKNTDSPSNYSDDRQRYKTASPEIVTFCNNRIRYQFHFKKAQSFK